MRITIGTFALCAGKTSSQFPADLELDGQEILQLAQFIRAVQTKPIPRGNTLTTVSFRVVREYANLRTALSETMKHHAAIPKTGLVEFVCQAENGTDTSLWLKNGFLKSHRVSPITGVSATHTYILQGGDFTTTKPT